MTKIHLTARYCQITLCLLSAPIFIGCGAEFTPQDDFISDNPWNYSYDDEYDSGQSASGTGTSGDGEENVGDGEREISEADIIHVENDRLYALSQFGGLAVIDVSTQDHLSILGRYRAHAEPFEMYVENSQVFIMFSDFGFYEYHEDGFGYTWHQSSRLVALDTSDPNNIQVRGEFPLPGRIQDSRRVGDILYLVTHEDGYCWNCREKPNTTITSLNIVNRATPKIIDQLTFDDENLWDWNRSVSSTSEHMYVSGMNHNDNWENGHSLIDVVDISDPEGKLHKGATIEVAGQIQSRWQMDEFDGVLRVVSQPGLWGSTHPPVVETFAVPSVNDVSPLGSTQMQLPRPESLRSVRFDQDRGYAITFEQTDPLFTLDLSDPVNPKQVGELEIPGWVYHMEPRGDRILALGFDPGNVQGALNASLFDVSQFDKPAMLSRVHFGGDWGNFAEGQNQIHKAFTILDEQELVLVPFSGWSYANEGSCYGTYQSGIQLIDYANDQLALRGIADVHGEARRAFMHDKRLFSMSDKSVASFDISNRDTPMKTADLALANNVNRVLHTGDYIVRLSLDWWTDENILEIVAANSPEDTQPLGKLALTPQAENPACGYSNLWGADLFIHDDYVYVVYETYQEYNYQEKTYLQVIDIHDKAAPVHIKTLELPFNRGYFYSQLDVSSQQTVKVGTSLIFARSHWNDVKSSYSEFFEIMDLSSPENPAHVATLPRKTALEYGRLKVFDGEAISWHMSSASQDDSKVRFYLDRFDLSDPQNPTLLEAVNVPGVTLAYADAQKRAITLDFQGERKKMAESACYSEPKYFDYDANKGECILLHRELKLVSVGNNSASLLDTLAVEQTGRLTDVVATPHSVYAQIYSSTDKGSKSELVTVTGLTDSSLAERSRLELDTPYGWYNLFVADDQHLAFSVDGGLSIVDASDPDHPTVDVHELYGYGCYDMAANQGQLVCAQGEYGVQLFELD